MFVVENALVVLSRQTTSGLPTVLQNSTVAFLYSVYRNIVNAAAINSVNSRKRKCCSTIDNVHRRPLLLLTSSDSTNKLLGSSAVETNQFGAVVPNYRVLDIGKSVGKVKESRD